MEFHSIETCRALAESLAKAQLNTKAKCILAGYNLGIEFGYRIANLAML